jgi:hypothetical protein
LISQGVSQSGSRLWARSPALMRFRQVRGHRPRGGHVSGLLANPDTAGCVTASVAEHVPRGATTQWEAAAGPATPN